MVIGGTVIFIMLCTSCLQNRAEMIFITAIIFLIFLIIQATNDETSRLFNEYHHYEMFL